MSRIYLQNGFMIVEKSEFTDTLKWLTEYNETKYFFHPNIYTKALFRRDIWPRISEFEYDMEDIKYLGTIDLSHKRQVTHEIVQPIGIELEDFQVKAVQHMLEHDRAGIYFGTGTGKTIITISYMLSTKPKRVVIVTPLRVLTQYMSQIKKYTDYEVSDQVKVLQNEYSALVINYESLHHLIGLNDLDLMILDESHKAKDFTSLTNETLRRLSVEFKEIYLFTGTPLDKNRFEILSQLAILDWRFLPGKTNFLKRYFEVDQYYSPIAELRPLELTYLIGDIIIAAETDDVLDLPPEVDHEIKIKKRDPLYDILFKKKVVVLEDGQTIVADSAGKLLNKLRQISNGHIITDQGNTILLETGKTEALSKFFKDHDRGIVFTEFDADVTKVLSVMPNDRSYTIVTGKTKAKDSGPAIEEFKAGRYNYLIIQSTSGNAGLDLWMVHETFFYGLPLSYIVLHQCKSRTRRYGQTQQCNYYFAINAGTVDTKIYRVLKQKKSFTTATFKKFKGVLENEPIEIPHSE